MYEVEKTFLEACKKRKVNVIMKNGYQQKGGTKGF